VFNSAARPAAPTPMHVTAKTNQRGLFQLGKLR
jgi:hypothetical protein